MGFVKKIALVDCHAEPVEVWRAGLCALPFDGAQGDSLLFSSLPTGGVRLDSIAAGRGYVRDASLHGDETPSPRKESHVAGLFVLSGPPAKSIEVTRLLFLSS